MAEKKIIGRAIQKHDVEANWLKATNFIPMQGEIIIYDVDENYDYERIKIGDGKTLVSDLPFYAGSWNDLADKPFGVGIGKGEAIVENKTQTSSPQLLSHDIGGPLIVGNTYYVVFNGVEYECVAEDNGEVEYGYDSVCFGSTDYSTFPFFIYTDCDNYGIDRLQAEYGDDVVNPVISVYKSGEVAVPLDEMYIPDTIARTSDIPEQITVDSSLSTSSTNPVQNKVVNDAISNLNTLVGDTSVSSQISAAIANKADSGHTHDDRYYTETEINTKLSAKADVDHTHEISELTDLSGATVNHAATADSADEATHATTADTANAVAWANVTGKPSEYTPATHSHAISDVTNLQTTLDAKVPTTRTVNGKALSANITLSASDVGADVSGAANTALTNAKAYTDAEISEWVGDETVSEQISTAIANKVDKVDGKGLSTNDYTTTEKNKLAGIASGAEVNQNAFANITVGSTTIAADSETDTLTFVAGNNVTITTDATNDKITIAATDTVYTHPTYTAKSSGLYKVTVDGTGHVSGTAAVAKSDITALGIPAQDTTYSAATTSAAGLMSAADKSKLDGIATGANKITVDSSLSSSSTNPVQNKVVNAAISNLNTLVGDTSVSSQITTAIENKSDVGHTHTASDVGADVSGSAASALSDAKVYTDTKISALINSAPTTLDTLGEIATAMEENADVVAALETAIGTKADAGHTHNYAGSSSAGGAATSANKLNTNAGSATQPVYFANGVPVKTTYTLGASVPSGAKFTDTTYSVATQSTDGLMSADDKKTLDTLDEYVGDSSVSSQISTAIANKADSDHTHSDYVNQNAFSNVTVGSTTIAADSATDTLTIVAGSNITITPDTTNDKITIAATDTVYTHPSYTARTGVPTANQTPAFGGTFTVSQPVSDATGHITAVNSRTVTIPSAVATTSAAGLMSAADKTKLNGIATGATKITVDSALSSTSTNPVQNKIVNTAITNLNTLVGDTAVSEQIEEAVSTKADIANGQYAITATSDDGIAYVATVPSITALASGVSFIMIPGKASSSTTPTLNVNGLGAKNIRRRLSNLATAVQTGYTSTWLAVNKPFRVTYDGSQWIVEGHEKPVGADLYGAAAKATADADGNVITETYATIAALQALLPKVTSITLTNSWDGTASPYYQDIALSCCTETSMVDIQPTPEQLVSWHDNGFAFTTLSGAGTVRVYVAGEQPTENITVQVKVQEVVVI